LLAYSLISRSRERRVLIVHRLVQAVLKDEMDDPTQRQWAERTLHVLDQLFPFSEATTWHLCERYLPHALQCEAAIQQWDLASLEVAHLLHNIASYLDDRAQYPEAEPLYQRALGIKERM